MSVTRADPALLDGYTAHTVAAVSRVWDGVASYRRAVVQLAAARTDLTVDVSDHSALLAATLSSLEGFDRTAAAFAAALRHADRAGEVVAFTGTAVRWITGNPLARIGSAVEDVAGAIQRSRALGRLVRGRWDMAKLRLRYRFALGWAHLRSLPARLWHGPGSPQAAARARRVAAHFGPAIARVQERVAAAAEVVRKPPGWLKPLGRVTSKIGIAGSAWTAVAGSPYEGTRGTIDRSVAIASLVATGAVAIFAGAAATSAVAAALTVAGGAILVGATAWAVANLAKDAWDHRKAIARTISSGARATGRAVANAAQAVGRAAGVVFDEVGAAVAGAF